MNEKNGNRSKVAIVGAGPAGLAAAIRLSRLGIEPVAVIEREPIVGGIPARYTTDDIPTFVMWASGRLLHGNRYADILRTRLQQTKVDVYLNSTVTKLQPDGNVLTIVSPQRGKWQLSADVILLACGARESSLAQRGWICGHRPAGIFFTNNVLELLDGTDRFDAGSVVFVGSEVTTYATAAKLARRGTRQITVVDKVSGPRCVLPKRAFFYYWKRPGWLGGMDHVNIEGDKVIQGLTAAPSGHRIPAGKLIISGDFLPNSELLADAGLPVDPRTRLAAGVQRWRIDNTGIFLAGNILGNSWGAQWSYLSGYLAAGRIAAFLHNDSRKHP